MAIEYTIKITRTRVKDEGSLTDIVKEVDFILTGVDQGCMFELPVTLKFPDPTGENFSPFDSLTKEQVEEWIWSQEEQLEPFKGHIAQVVAKEVAKNTLTEKNMPWDPVETVNTGTNV